VFARGVQADEEKATKLKARRKAARQKRAKARAKRPTKRQFKATPFVDPGKGKVKASAAPGTSGAPWWG
jgi:hypothetical protein